MGQTTLPYMPVIPQKQAVDHWEAAPAKATHYYQGNYYYIVEGVPGEVIVYVWLLDTWHNVGISPDDLLDVEKRPKRKIRNYPHGATHVLNGVFFKFQDGGSHKVWTDAMGWFELSLFESKVAEMQDKGLTKL